MKWKFFIYVCILFCASYKTICAVDVPSFRPTKRVSRKPSQEPTISKAPSTKPSISPTIPASYYYYYYYSPSTTTTNTPFVGNSEPLTMPPSRSFSSVPSAFPSNFPSSLPTQLPTAKPISKPSFSPSQIPTSANYYYYYYSPSYVLTNVPFQGHSTPLTNFPTDMPLTSFPSLSVTQPTVLPSATTITTKPTMAPSIMSTFSNIPSNVPTFAPTIISSNQPTYIPSIKPTTFLTSVTPSVEPSMSPTLQPTTEPTQTPSFTPSILPSNKPSLAPSKLPLTKPSLNPSVLISTYIPTIIPTIKPTTVSPTSQPSYKPSSLVPVSTVTPPSNHPSVTPSVTPSFRVSAVAPTHTPLPPTTAPTSTKSIIATTSHAPSTAAASSSTITPISTTATSTTPPSTNQNNVQGTSMSTPSLSLSVGVIAGIALAGVCLLIICFICYYQSIRSHFKQNAESTLHSDQSSTLQHNNSSSSSRHNNNNNNNNNNDFYSISISVAGLKKSSSGLLSSPRLSLFPSLLSPSPRTSETAVAASQLNNNFNNIEGLNSNTAPNNSNNNPCPTFNWKDMLINTELGDENIIGQGSFGKVIKARIQKRKATVENRSSSLITKSHTHAPSRYQDIVVKVIKTPNKKHSKLTMKDYDVELKNAIKEVKIHLGVQNKIINKSCIVKVLGIVQGELSPDWANTLNNLKAVGIVMNYETGGSLGSIIHNKHLQVTLVQKIRILWRIALGLAELHKQGISHGDIKPDNILLSSKDISQCEVRLADFGLAEIHERGFLGDTSLAETKTDRGTPIYCAPEQLYDPFRVIDQGSFYAYKKPSDKTDMYSFAILIWEVLSEQHPYADISTAAELAVLIHQGSRPLIDLLPLDCPVAIRNMIERCWDFDARKRKSAIESATILRQCRDELVNMVYDVYLTCKYDKQREVLINYIRNRLMMKGGFKVAVAYEPGFEDPISTSTRTCCRHSGASINYFRGNNNNSNSNNNISECLTSAGVSVVNCTKPSSVSLRDTPHNGNGSSTHGTPRVNPVAETVTPTRRNSRHTTPRTHGIPNNNNSPVRRRTSHNVNNANNTSSLVYNNSYKCLSSAQCYVCEMEEDSNHMNDEYNSNANANATVMTATELEEMRIMEMRADKISQLTRSKIILLCLDEQFQTDNECLYELQSNRGLNPPKLVIPLLLEPKSEERNFPDGEIRVHCQLGDRRSKIFDISSYIATNNNNSASTSGIYSSHSTTSLKQQPHSSSLLPPPTPPRPIFSSSQSQNNNNNNNNNNNHNMSTSSKILKSAASDNNIANADDSNNNNETAEVLVSYISNDTEAYSRSNINDNNGLIGIALQPDKTDADHGNDIKQYPTSTSSKQINNSHTNQTVSRNNNNLRYSPRSMLSSTDRLSSSSTINSVCSATPMLFSNEESQSSSPPTPPRLSTVSETSLTSEQYNYHFNSHQQTSSSSEYYYCMDVDHTGMSREIDELIKYIQEKINQY